MTTYKNPFFYKKVKVSKKHCSLCRQKLRGNGSDLAPYSCRCGTWEMDWYTSKWDLKKNYERTRPS